jgi:hypothetical protein
MMQIIARPVLNRTMGGFLDPCPHEDRICLCIALVIMPTFC